MGGGGGGGGGAGKRGRAAVGVGSAPYDIGLGGSAPVAPLLPTPMSILVFLLLAINIRHSYTITPSKAQVHVWNSCVPRSGRLTS